MRKLAKSKRQRNKPKNPPASKENIEADILTENIPKKTATDQCKVISRVRAAIPIPEFCGLKTLLGPCGSQSVLGCRVSCKGCHANQNLQKTSTTPTVRRTEPDILADNFQEKISQKTAERYFLCVYESYPKEENIGKITCSPKNPDVKVPSVNDFILNTLQLSSVDVMSKLAEQSELFRIQVFDEIFKRRDFKKVQGRSKYRKFKEQKARAERYWLMKSERQNDMFINSMMSVFEGANIHAWVNIDDFSHWLLQRWWITECRNYKLSIKVFCTNSKMSI